jgi:uncharacterized membrane protein
MSDTNASSQADEPFFQALLTPHRSLGRTGFAVLMGALLFGWVVSRTSLDIRKTAPSGRSEAHRFNPFWARFSVARHAEIGITRMAVEAQGQNVPIGSFLDPDSRESFATAFSRALATAKTR